jgi:hypothetical protein
MCNGLVDTANKAPIFHVYINLNQNNTTNHNKCLKYTERGPRVEMCEWERDQPPPHCHQIEMSKRGLNSTIAVGIDTTLNLDQA